MIRSRDQLVAAPTQGTFTILSVNGELLSIYEREITYIEWVLHFKVEKSKKISINNTD